MIKKFEKNNVIKFLVIFTITLLICQNFLQMHFSSDTYVLYDLGYMNYPKSYFLLDGRIISSLVCFLAGIINIPLEVYIIGMDFIGIIFIAMSIYIINQLLENIIKPKRNIDKVALTASCFILILNQFTLEFLLFPESAVICLSELFIVLAIKVMIEKQKYMHLKIFLLLMFSALCYQCILNIFPVLVILVYMVKGSFDDGENKIKDYLLEMIKLFLIILLILIICIITIKICNKIMNHNIDKQYQLRFTQLANFNSFISKLKQLKNYYNTVWNNSLNMLPPYLGNIIIVITLILLFTFGAKKKIIAQYIILLITTFFMFTIESLVFRYIECGRLNVPLMMIWGVSLIVLLTQSQLKQKSIIENVVYAIIFLSFIINSIFLMQNITEHIASNRVEENIGKTIKTALEEYEKKSGITVKKFGFIKDINSQRYSIGIKQIGALTERKFGKQLCIKGAMNYYCERKFRLVKFSVPKEIYTEKVYKKDYTEFSNDQLIFYKDAVFMVVY